MSETTPIWDEIGGNPNDNAYNDLFKWEDLLFADGLSMQTSYLLNWD